MGSIDALAEKINSLDNLALVVGERRTTQNPYDRTGRITCLNGNGEHSVAGISKISRVDLVTGRRYLLSSVTATADPDKTVIANENRGEETVEGAVEVRAMIGGEETVITAYPVQEDD